MLDQLAQLVKEFGQDAVVKNDAIPNDKNDAVLEETGNSLFSSLQKIASSGDLSQIANLLQGKDIDKKNPVVHGIISNVSELLTQKLGINAATATDTATNIIPKVLNILVERARDPKNSSISISELLNSLTGGDSPEHAGIMEAISTYDIHFGLDQNTDGKVDLDDAAELTKKGGLGGMMGKLFGK
ncbi:hypothetical protein ABS764_11980 [Flavobacterium sp. ST-87]|uniref:EF-hand domain-containing protein n=1 Tax=Flavobacterium plantiphilum TaxID=3163297 RepID=A0ABW8XUI9_9FLAO